MQATIGCLSRIFSRTFVNNVATGGASVGGGTNNKPENRKLPTCHVYSGDEVDAIPSRLVTAVSGFPKSQNKSPNGGFNIDNILKGQIGDDAYFVARHVDDWDSTKRVVSSQRCVDVEESVEYLLNPLAASTSIEDESSGCPSSVVQSHRRRRFYPPSRGSLSEENLTNRSHQRHAQQQRPPSNSADVIGVADGVGGWRQYGVDPGQFSAHLMQSCERLVCAGYFAANQPARLLAQGFLEMQQSKKSVIGSSTACLAMLNHSDGKLYTANIGDSGLVVIRGGQVVHRSSEQQHYFNTPYQLSLPPSEMASDVLSDRPESADRYVFNVEDGDVIILATDGVFDNVPDALLAREVGTLEGFTNDPHRVQACANSIALMARTLSRDETYMSPFAKNAQANGFSNVIGGKEDDVTVLLAAVILGCSTRTERA